jgi:hypothetical protein
VNSEDTTTDAVARFEDDRRQTGIEKLAASREPGNTRADHNYLVRIHPTYEIYPTDDVAAERKKGRREWLLPPPRFQTNRCSTS